jgi:hypothetical protein
MDLEIGPFEDFQGPASGRQAAMEALANPADPQDRAVPLAYSWHW